ncbi:MAG: DegV family EDD domain-containing protein [Clostridiales bacterium]|nr:DegV family EDD domain-containing protein [Clostridiales bacterium]
MSLFFVDSSSELNKNDIKMLGIECIDMPYSLNDKKMTVSEECDYDKVYSKCRKDMCLNYVELSVQEYIDIFEPCLQQNDDIIYVHASSQIFSIDNLEKAKEQLKEKYPDNEIYLIDSKNFSIGYGVVAYLLALQYRKGETIQDIVELSHTLKDEIATTFVVDSVENLYNHSLISSTAVAGTVLNVKPMISVDIDGDLQLVDKQSGKRRAINEIIMNIRQTGKNIVDYPIGITYSDCEKDAIYLKDKLLEYFGEDCHIIMNKLTPSNCSLLGTGSLGVAYHVFKKIH